MGSAWICDLLQDRQAEGDRVGLFGAPSRRVHAVFSGDAGIPDDQAGVLELNVSTVTSRPGRRPRRGGPERMTA